MLGCRAEADDVLQDAFLRLHGSANIFNPEAWLVTVVTLDKEELRKLLDYITRPFNFLKHAQRDPLATLDDEDVDPDGTIVHALTAFSMVCPRQKLPDQIAPFLLKHGVM